uniref:Core Histone H2A/H2B/H3 domain-containing protein n=1 Tax=Anopheles christyi TaxID=43041 RepID=A0A182KHY3_9DIPT
MAPRKNTKKQSKTSAGVRQQATERTPSPPRRSPVEEPAFRSLRTVNELCDVMGDESASGSDMESYRDNTSQSRPNFSFLPSHKHSSPNHQNYRQAKQPPATVHRLTSMPTVPNTGLNHEDTESPDRSNRHGTSSSSSMSTFTKSGRNHEDTQPPGPSSRSRKTSRSERGNSSNIGQPTASSSAPPTSQPARRKQKTPSNLQALKEIHRLQGTVHNLIPKLSFARLIREVLSEYSHRQLRVTVTMLECLQESAEVYLVQLFGDSYRCTLHRERVTLMPKDMQLAAMLRRD